MIFKLLIFFEIWLGFECFGGFCWGFWRVFEGVLWEVFKGALSGKGGDSVFLL